MQFVGNFLVSLSIRHQLEHLDLARGQSRRPRAPFGPVLPGGGEHGIDGIGCQAPRADLPAQFGGGLLEREGRPVRPGGAGRAGPPLPGRRP